MSFGFIGVRGDGTTSSSSSSLDIMERATKAKINRIILFTFEPYLRFLLRVIPAPFSVVP